MLTPELNNLKKKLEGMDIKIDKNKLLEELTALDEMNIMALYESLSLSNKVCKSCGRPF